MSSFTNDGDSRDLSIIIVSWNVKEMIAGCLRSIEVEQQTGEIDAVETIVVDNNSSDGTAAFIQSDFPWVILKACQNNLGFSGGNNLGIRISRGRMVLLLNPDTIIHSGSLAILVNSLKANPTYGILGPRLLNSDGSLQPSCYPSPTLIREFWRLFYLDKLYPHGIYRMKKWDSKNLRSVDNIMGAGMLLRREIVDTVGLMDEDYFMFSEEIDYCKRVRSAGWDIGWEPRAIFTHFGGGSTRQVREKMFIQLYRAKVYYFRKHYGHLSASIYKVILYLAAWARIACGWFLLRQKSQERGDLNQLQNNYRKLILALPGF